MEIKKFRNALGCFVTGVTIVTTRDLYGKPVGVTANSFSSVSLDPPLVLWSLAKASYSFPAFSSCDAFCVHVLAEGQEAIATQFAKGSNDKFANVNIKDGFGSVPVIDNYMVRFDCSIYNRYDGGDHIIIVGEVVDFVVDNNKNPLAFYKGSFKNPAYNCVRAILPASDGGVTENNAV
ncbi:MULTISPECIES: flavin reductase family protein [Paraburkholderia]|uniref:flavin reductase family protein n=1 Tax=Paraburkholderia TaxID=1822464 RepID=UPI000B4907B5|nr:hypothetical protein BWU74_30975 [Burkholderia sp. Bk]